jgi:hypothetical protein
MSDIAPDAKILEDGEDILLGDSTEADGTEFADIGSLGKPGEDEADLTAAAAKPAAAAVKPAAAAAAAATGEDDDLPQEFKGKSRKDIAKMYQDAHKVIGRQGSELGELRAKADHAIKLSLEAIRAGRAPAPADAKPAVEEKLDESELFSKPTEFLNKVLANSPVIKEIRDSLGQAAAQQATSRAAEATQRFIAAHPDANEILRDPEFRQWVNASRVRTSLLQRAHSRFDFDAGDEVFSTWKALKGVKHGSTAGEQPAAAAAAPAAAAAQATAVTEAAKTLAAARKAKQDAAARAAGVPTGGAAGASAGKGGKPVFRRVDVMRLMVEDPDRYEALSDEIRIAYEEGRVR